MATHISKLFLMLSATIAFCVGCADSPSGPGMGTMNVRMTDSPGEFESVNLVITRVSAHWGTELESDDASSSDDSGTWIDLTNAEATYDLLTLQNGVFATIGMGEVPAGRYTQIRLMLGPGSNVVVDGVTYPLTVPSGLQTGLKLVGTFDVPEGGLLDIALDFDAARSVVQNGAGSFHLKPTVKVLPFNTAGAITGHVSPAGTATTVYAVQADTVGSTTAAADGGFTLAVLTPGIYSLAFRPASGFRDTTITGVVVEVQETTDVGTIELTPQ